MKFSLVVLTAAAVIAIGGGFATAQTWVGPNVSQDGASGSWATAANWNPATVPNAAGAAVILNTPPATRTITVDSGATGFTVGSITFNDNSAFANTLSTGISGSNLILNNSGSGVLLQFNGSGASLANNTVSVPMVFNDNVTAEVNYQANSTAGISTQGAFNWTGSVSGGSGGFTKTGNDLMTMGTAAKAYTGPTALNAGRLRISAAGRPTATSSFTVNAGGQLNPITAGGTYTFGANSNVPLNLNGTGATTGTFAGFPGALRPDSDLVCTIANQVVLQTDSQINIFSRALTGTLTFSNAISGGGKLTMGGGDGEGNHHGTLKLSGGNSTYSGGTSIIQGTIEVATGAADPTKPSLGTGNVFVDGLSDNGAGVYSWGHLVIDSNVQNAILDTAQLKVDFGNPSGTPAGDVTLGSGVNETVGSLVLNGATKQTGVTYGSTTSGAVFQDDNYFHGAGVITIGLLGDFDGSHTVDAADYVFWRKNYGDNTAMYDAWRSNFGATTLGGSSGLGAAAVPEPSTIALFTLFSLLFAAGRRGRFAVRQ